MAKIQYSTGREAANNMTIFLQNVSYPLNFCTDAAEQIFYYIETQQALYGSTGSFLRAAMTNLFSNAIRV